MTRTPISAGRAARRGALGVAALVLAMLTGCACSDTQWVASGAWPAEIGEPAPECTIEGIEKRSKLSAEIAGSADPELLAESRREAERACEEQRLRNAGGWRAAELK